MALTPLFPSDGQDITIRQGRAGDCYLLVIIDALLHGDQHTQKSFKNIFKQKSDGSVEVRLQHGDLSKNLKLDRLHRRGYHYDYDKEKNQDVYTIPKELLQEFDSSLIGVQTNALAVKILEHLVPYYYFEDWHVNVALHSVIAHDIHNRHGNHLKSTEFTAALLGFNVHETPGTFIDEIIERKVANPDVPIYISMSYGTEDMFGQFHGRHALRIKQIIEMPGGNHQFILINPWNNTKTETFYLNDIKRRNPRFSEFSPSTEQLAHIKAQQDLPFQIATPKEDLPSIDIQVRQSINQAINQTSANKPEFTWFMAQEYVLKGILRYSFTGEPTYLTRNGNLRMLFTSIAEYGFTDLENAYFKEVKKLPNLVSSMLDLALGDLPSGYETALARKRELLDRLKAFEATKDIEEIQFSPGLTQNLSLKVINIKELISELSTQVEALAAQSPEPLAPLNPVIPPIDLTDPNRGQTPDLHIKNRKNEQLNEIVSKAIEDKEQTGLSPLEAKKLVHKGVLNFVFFNAFSSITRSGGLREYLIENSSESDQNIKYILDGIDYTDEAIIDNIIEDACHYMISRSILTLEETKLELLQRLIALNTHVPDIEDESFPELFKYLLEYSSLSFDTLIKKLQSEIKPTPSPKSPVIKDQDIQLDPQQNKEPIAINPFGNKPQKIEVNKGDKVLDIMNNVHQAGIDEVIKDKIEIKPTIPKVALSMESKKLKIQLEKYISERQTERSNANGQEYHFFRKIFSFFNMASPSYTAQSKIDSAQKVIDYLDGKAVSFDTKNLEAIQEGRLGKIIRATDALTLKHLTAPEATTDIDKPTDSPRKI